MQAKLFTFTLAGNTEKLTSHIRESSDFFLMTKIAQFIIETIVADINILNFLSKVL